MLRLSCTEPRTEVRGPAGLSQRFGVDSRLAEHSRTEPRALARGPALGRRESVWCSRPGARALTGTALFGRTSCVV